ncbi:MAG TPA: hypothetical protein VFZ70_07640 [Euzebyales bacterium]
MTIEVALDRTGGTTAAADASGGLVDALDRDLLEAHAGWLIYMRGVDYASHGHVTELRVAGDRATAVVQGTRPYDVTVEAVGSTLAFECSCPMGGADEFCKHLVALGVELIGDVNDGEDAIAGTFAPDGDDIAVDVVHEDPDAVDLEAWLGEQSADRLRELLVAEAARDPEVRRRLSLIAAADAGARPELSALRARIIDAFAMGHHDRYGFVHYRHAYAWAHDVDTVIDEVGELLGAGFAAEAVELTETILESLNDSVGSVDDSDGHLYGLFETAADLHLRACQDAPPDPVALAGRLLRWATSWELDGFLDAIGDYASVLGDTGLAAYRTLAEQRWAQIPAIGPGDDPRARHHDRFAITRVMEELAEATGGIDELLEVMARDQASGHAFVRIATACRNHGRDDLALDWAQRGRDAFPAESRLTELIGDIHADNGRHDDAVVADRELFRGGPSLARYRRLKDHADAVGRWPNERASALKTLREQIAHRRHETPQRTSPWSRADGSVLVEILLWEGDADAAWAAAQRFGCNDGLWLHVAAARGTDHPTDALGVYRRHLERALEPADNRAYDDVVRLLKTMRPLYAATDDTDAFNGLVADVRTTYKRRRNLIARLDRARL